MQQYYGTGAPEHQENIGGAAVWEEVERLGGREGSGAEGNVDLSWRKDSFFCTLPKELWDDAVLAASLF